MVSKLIKSYFSHYANLPINAVIALLAIFVYFLGYASIAFLPLYLHHDLYFSFSQVGLILGAFGLGTIIASFYGGRLCDYFSAYYLSIISLIIYLTTLALAYFVAKSEWITLALFFLLGIGSAAFSPASRIYLMNSVSVQDQARVNTIRYVLLNVGTALSFSIAAFLIKDNYQRIFPLTFFFCVIVLIVFLCLKPEAELANQPKSTEKVKFWKNRFLFLILIAFFMGMLVFSQLNSSYSLFLSRHYHLQSQQIALLFILNSLIIVLIQMPLLTFFKNFSQPLLMNMGCAIVGSGFFILPFGNSYFLVLLSMCIITFGEMLFIPVAQNLVYQHAQSNQKGYYMGVYQLLYSSTIMFAPFLSGYALEYNTSGFLLWGASFFICLIPIMIFIFFKNHYNMNKENQ